MSTPELPPRVQQGNRFRCPHCGAFSQQLWPEVALAGSVQHRVRVARCVACNDLSLWVDEKMVWPDTADVPPPNADLGDAITDDYREAAAILERSPRGAAALLRLAIQKLCVSLGLTGRDLNSDIGELVKRGLSPTIQQALDSVRVIGNNAFHPGVMDLQDDVTTARSLFTLVNAIAETLITLPKQAEAIYQSLPDSSKEAIEERDSTT